MTYLHDDATTFSQRTWDESSYENEKRRNPLLTQKIRGHQRFLFCVVFRQAGRLTAGRRTATSLNPVSQQCNFTVCMCWDLLCAGNVSEAIFIPNDSTNSWIIWCVSHLCCLQDTVCSATLIKSLLVAGWLWHTTIKNLFDCGTQISCIV
jgi:hypothetical protein